MYQSPVCYKHKGKSGDFTFRSTKGDEENEEETGWWEEGDSSEEETRQVADLAKGYSEDEGGGVWTLQQIVVGVILLLMILDLLF